MNLLTWINTVILGIIVIAGWLKLAHGDANDGCCAMILLLAACGFTALGFAIFGIGSLFGWW